VKVLHIVAGNLSGGAARGAYWLHKALVEFGIESKIWTNSKDTFSDERVYSILKNKKENLLNFFRNQIDSNIQIFYPNRKRVIFSTGIIGVDFTKSELYKQSDIIHLHWINAGLVNIKHLKKIDKPIVWTMRDMWPMTGGCHYAMNCKNYKNGCGLCMQLNSKGKYDLSRFILNRKKKYFQKDIKIVGISKWLSDKAKESELFREFDVQTIHNNIDTEEFLPIEKKVAKKILGIITNKKIILCGATNIFDFYKGFSKFIDAINLFDRKKYYLCFFGKFDKETKKLIDNLGFEYKSFGYIYDNISLRLVYSGSDVFLAPSIMDAFGKTLAESMSCGTPVVCFDATGPKDIVDNKVNGYLAKSFDTSDLAKGIEWVLNAPNYDELCKNAREKVVREFDSKVVAGKYIRLYEEILKGRVEH